LLNDPLSSGQSLKVLDQANGAFVDFQGFGKVGDV
jgi:hypothetical protein